MTQVYLAIGAPFVAAVVGLLGGRLRPRVVVPVAVTGTAVSLVAALVMTGRVVTTDGLVDRSSLDTVPLGGGLTFGLDLRLDGLAAVVSVAVTIVALMVQVYSTAYLKGDPRYSSYAALVSLFTAAMLLVVFADDLFVLLVGWEVMGVCSYFLIGHHWEQEGSRAGAVKAFVTTRLGDVGFLFGIFTMGHAFGTFSIDRIVANAAVLNGRVPSDVLLNVSGTTTTVATLLLLCGVVGKSAQFPLHTWLPDAMAGPTPDQCADPRRHHGRRRHLLRGPALRRVPAVTDDAGRDGADRLPHHVRCRAGGAGAGRHQAGARLLHRQPARLHAGRPVGRVRDWRRRSTC